MNAKLQPPDMKYCDKTIEELCLEIDNNTNSELNDKFKFNNKCPQLSTLFWDIQSPQKLLLSEPLAFFQIVNRRYESLSFVKLNDFEWGIIFVLEKHLNQIFFFLTEKKMYKSGFYEYEKQNPVDWFENKVKLLSDNAR